MKIIDIGVGKIGVAESAQEPPQQGLDAALFAFTFSREVRLKSEIRGETSFAAAMAAQSAQCDYPLLCGCRTVWGSVRHVSVMTFAGGRLCDVADRTFNLDGGEYASGDTVKILRLRRFDLGLLVDTDVLLAKNWQRIASRCGAVAGLARHGTDADYGYIPTLSSLFGKPYVVAFAGGELLWGTPETDLPK